MTKEIVQKILNVGGTFLKFDASEHDWREVSNEEAHLKVAHMMHDGREKPLGQLEPEMFSPTT